MVTASHHIVTPDEKAKPSKEMLDFAAAIAAAVVESLQRVAANGGVPEDLKKLLNGTPAVHLDEERPLPTPRILPADPNPTSSGRSFLPIEDDAFAPDKKPEGQLLDTPLPAAVAPLLRQSALHTGFIPNYELISKLDEDESCERFLARDLKRHVNVVVHLISKYLNDQPGYLERLTRALNGFIDLNHSAIVKVYERGFHQGLPFYVTETVPGKTLADIIALSGPMAELDVLRMCIQLAEGMQYVHNKLQLTHGELKPSSIIVAYSGLAGVAAISESESIKVGDFFRMPTLWHDSSRVSSMASPVYVSPERLGGLGSPDVRSDIYSIGAIMYHLLSGKAPFSGTPDEVRNGHLKKPLPDLAEVMPAVSPMTREIVQTALAKDLKDRFLSYQGFIVACQKALKGLAALDSSSMRILRKPMAKPVPIKPTRNGREISESNRTIPDPTPIKEATVEREEEKPLDLAGTESRLINLIAKGVAQAYTSKENAILAEAGRLHDISTRIIRKYVSEQKARAELEGEPSNTTALVRKVDSLLRKKKDDEDESGSRPNVSIHDDADGIQSLRDLSTRILRRHLRHRAVVRRENSTEPMALVRRRVNLRSISGSKERPQGRRKLSWGYRRVSPFSIQINLLNVLYVVGVVVFTAFIGVWLIKALFAVFVFMSAK